MLFSILEEIVLLTILVHKHQPLQQQFGEEEFVLVIKQVHQQCEEEEVVPVTKQLQRHLEEDAQDTVYKQEQ